MLCAIYCRLSKEDEDKQQQESESIQNQKSMLVKYAVDHGWDIYDLYCDEDYSGADTQRPRFNKMLADAEARCFQIILCKTQSRFTRDMELVEKYIHGKFLIWGIRFVAIADNVDTDVKGNKKARQINGLINEWYLEDLSENIRMVFDYKRRQGQFIGGFAVYGYRKDPDNKNKLLIDEEVAPIVRQIFQWYLEGNGAQHITYLLNRHGYPNPTKHKQSQGSKYVNCSQSNDFGLWNKTTVTRILHNEVYTGVMVQGRQKKISYKSKSNVMVPKEDWCRVPGTHEAIIDGDTFCRVQELMKPHVKTDGLGEIHVLGGLVKCADCGGTMSKTSNRKNSGERISYLRCKLSTAGVGQALCTRHSIRLDCLIETVTQRLQEHIGAYYTPGNLSRFEGRQKLNDKTALLQKELRTIEGKIENRSAALKALYLDKVSGLMGEEQFFSLNGDFLAEKEKLTVQKKELAAELVTLGEMQGNQQGVLERVQKLLCFEPMPRELFVLAIDRIEIGEKNRKTGQQEVHITWKF